LKDLRDRLAEVSGDRAFADGFFDKYIEGREVADYAALLAHAGIAVRRQQPGAAWSGLEDAMRGDEPTRVGSLVEWGTPAFKAGIEQGDVITAVDGQPFSGGIAKALAPRKPGDRVTIEFRRPTGAAVKTTMALGEDPSLAAVAVESSGGTLTAAQKAFRDAWLGPRVR
jgi:predicted metalloprotease with PDZ domain